MSPGYFLTAGPERRLKYAAYGPESASVDAGVWVSDRLGQFVVIFYSVFAKVEIPQRTANAPVIFVVTDSMSFCDIGIIG